MKGKGPIKFPTLYYSSSLGAISPNAKQTM
jgi:hypothetical protein